MIPDALLFVAACVAVALSALAWLSTNVAEWGRCMSPIILPPPADSSWNRARSIAAALRAKGKGNAFIVAAVANGYAESAWKPVIVGDHGQSFGPWQIKWSYFGPAILEATGVDIRNETDLARHVDAVLWLLEEFATASGVLPFARVIAELNAATTGAEATRAWCVDFEKASAGAAAERRVAIAPTIEVWLAKLAA